ncbi:MAG TPA: ATP-binding protein [Gemmatimonadota bacterium]|nr:ATP-binding protein [Gemmatimonadota bacterium]
MRLRNRILLTYLAFGMVVATVAGVVLYRTATGAARSGIEDRVTTGLRLVTVALEDATAPADADRLDALVDDLGAAADARITIIGPDGRVLADSQFDGAGLAALDDHGGRAEVVEARARGEGASVRDSRSVDTRLLYRARRVDRGPWRGSVARIAVPFTRVDAARDAAGRGIAAALALALGLALLAGALWARRLSRPIARLSETAQRVERGDLGARVRVSTGDEIEDLARALDGARNQLATRIDETTLERERLEAVLDGMAEGVLVTDQAGRVSRTNPALRRIFGLERPVTGRSLGEAIRSPGVTEAFNEVSDGRTVSREIRVTWPAERTLTVHAVGLPEGGAVAVFHDITALKRVDTVRRDFVSNVSHELRTPLTALSGYAEALSDPGLSSAEVAEHAAVIRRHVERLAALVSDLLELARLEESGFAPHRERFSAEELLRELAREWTPKAEDRGMTLSVAGGAGVSVDGDRGLLRQALANLLENGVKYCRQGDRIEISARSVEGGSELAVSDTGPGIPHEDQARVFERFYRLDKGRSREQGGTGLGLSIVRHAAEAHGGAATLESRPGAGATFRIFVPSRPGTAGTPDGVRAGGRPS